LLEQDLPLLALPVLDRSIVIETLTRKKLYAEREKIGTGNAIGEPGISTHAMMIEPMIASHGIDVLTFYLRMSQSLESAETEQAKTMTARTDLTVTATSTDATEEIETMRRTRKMTTPRPPAQAPAKSTL